MGIIMMEGVINNLLRRSNGVKTYFSPVPHNFDSTWIPGSGGQIFLFGEVLVGGGDGVTL